MIQVDISHLVPGFLLNDHNGAALAKAIEKGMQIFCQTLQNGIDTVIRVDKMEEWRLDEMAWELGCLYDFDADIENKRAWIRDAIPLYASLGTQRAVYLYLSGYFEAVEVEENWQYGAPAYHFRVTVSGEWTDKKEQWAKRAIESTKNVRSVLDDLAFGSSTSIHVTGQTMWRRFPYEMTDESGRAGMRPYTALIGKASDVFLSAMATAEGFNYPYKLAGTHPRENTVSGQGDAAATAFSDGAGTVFSYPQTGGNTLCGAEIL